MSSEPVAPVRRRRWGRRFVALLIVLLLLAIPGVYVFAGYQASLADHERAADAVLRDMLKEHGPRRTKVEVPITYLLKPITSYMVNNDLLPREYGGWAYVDWDDKKVQSCNIPFVRLQFSSIPSLNSLTAFIDDYYIKKIDECKNKA